MSAHEAVAALIPWYVNGTLDEHDMATITAHLDTCAACAREVEATLVCARAFHEAPHPSLRAALAGRDVSFARLARRLPRSKPRTPTAARARSVTAWSAAILMVLSGTWLWHASEPGDVDFEAMTSTPSVAGATVLQVIFQPATTERDVRELILDAGGELVGSPSPKGVYRIAVPGLPDAEAYAERLRRHPIVRWVEVERR